MTWARDTIEVEAVESRDWGGGVLDNLTSVSISLDLTAPSEASFEVGDDGTFAEIAQALGPGQRYGVKVNGRRLVSGRIEARDVPLDARAGSVARFTVRSWLADAMFTSCRHSIDVRGTLLDFVLDAYEGLGVGEDRMVFQQSLARDLRSGQPSEGRGPWVRLDALKVEEARVQVGETVYAAVDRHLRRHGLMHWDGPDDTIVFGYPDQGQAPTYDLRMKRGAQASSNNVLGMTRTEDYSQVPSSVIVHGGARPKAGSRFLVSGVAVDVDATRAGFARPVVMLAEGLRSNAAAYAAAERELAGRVRDKDSLAIEVDGLSYRHPDGGSVLYAPDTVASVENDAMGGSSGAYYVHRVELSRDGQGDRANLSGLRAGLWRLFPEGEQSEGRG